jgi:hypothetical protein
MISSLKTTLDIDDDVLFAAKELAAKEHKTVGKILSDIFRLAVQSGNTGPDSPKLSQPYTMKNGIPVLPSRDEVITAEHIRRIMVGEEI